MVEAGVAVLEPKHVCSVQEAMELRPEPWVPEHGFRRPALRRMPVGSRIEGKIEFKDVFCSNSLQEYMSMGWEAQTSGHPS